jgi:hypothetical protein
VQEIRLILHKHDDDDDNEDDDYCLHLRSNLKTEESKSANVLCDIGDDVLKQSRTYKCSQQG